MQQNQPPEEQQSEASAEQQRSESRRAFLKKAGKFAVYTPPAVMLLMKPSYATFRKTACGIDGYHDFNHENYISLISRLRSLLRSLFS